MITFSLLLMDWLWQTFPTHKFEIMKHDLDLLTYDTVYLNGEVIGRIADDHFVPWIGRFSPLVPYNFLMGDHRWFAANPAFFDNLKDWIENDVIPTLEIRKLVAKKS